MFVSELMTKDVAMVSADASVSKAFQILYEKKHSQLPVVDGDKLVGLVTEKLLAEVSPSKATSLSVFELNYLLSKTKVKDIMKTKIFTVGPDALIEEAALLMYSNDIGSLPVVKADKTLIGILTRLDIFHAFVEILGVNDKGTRISLEVEDHVGIIADVAKILKEKNLSIRHISNYSKQDREELVIRVDTLDIQPVLDAFAAQNYKITSVHKYE